MKREYFLVTLFFFLAAVFLYLFYRIIIPFFVPITWAAVFAILFRPLYDKILRKLHSPNTTAVIMCVFILVIIIGPIAYIFAALVNEAASAVAEVNAMYRAGEFDNFLKFDLPWMNSIRDMLSQYYDMSQVNLDQLVKDALERVTGVLFNQTSWLIANGTKTVFYFVLMLFTMFYFFRDGDRVVNKVKRLMPLPQDQVDRVLTRLRDVIYATMYGGVAVALVQGVLGGVLFALLGISSAVFWGAVMAFLSIIPMIGAFVVYIPAGIILIIGGSYWKGFLVIAIGTLVISQIDNLIRPYLIAGRTEMHPLMLFFTIMGGVAMFGLLGVVVGPLIAAVFVTLLKLFEVRLHPDDEPPLAESGKGDDAEESSDADSEGSSDEVKAQPNEG